MTIRHNIILFFVVLLCSFIVHHNLYAEAVQLGEYVSYPYPFYVEDGESSPKIISTSMHLKFREIRYGVSYEEFLSKSPAEDFFLNIINLLLAKDKVSLKEYMTGAQFNEEKRERLANGYLGGFERIRQQDLFVTNQLILKNTRVFFCGIKPENSSNGNAIVMCFMFALGEDGRFSIEGSDIEAYPLIQAIVFLNREILNGSKDYIANNANALEYEIPIFDKDSGTAVFLQFNGAEHDLSLNSQSLHIDPVIGFYQKYWNAFTQKTYKDVSAFYLEPIRESFESWALKEKGQGRYEEHKDILFKQNRKVYFVIKANPIYIVFYKYPGRDNYKPLGKKYDYVYFDKEQQNYYIINSNFYHYTDDLMTSAGMFGKTFLKAMWQKNKIASQLLNLEEKVGR